MVYTNRAIHSKAGFKGYNAFFRPDFPWEPLVLASGHAHLLHSQGSIQTYMPLSRPSLCGATVSNATQSGPQQVPIKMNPKWHTPRHIIIKMTSFKDKERILKAAREKQEVTYMGAPIRLAVDFSSETLQAKKEWQEIFQVIKSKGLQLRLLYPARLSIKIEGEIVSQTKVTQRTKMAA